MTRWVPKSSNVRMHLPRIFPLLCLVLLAPALESQNSSASPPAAQSPTTPTTTLSVNVKVVNLPVTVRDKHGKIVTNLTKDAFSLEEDGKPQTINYFRQENNLPLTVGLLVEEVEVLLPHGFDELLAAYSKAPDARRHDILRVVKIMAELR